MIPSYHSFPSWNTSSNPTFCIHKKTHHSPSWASRTSLPYRSLIVNPILLEPGRRGWAGRFNQWCYQSNWYVFWFSFFFLLVDGHCIVRRMIINLLKINSRNRPQRLASSVNVPLSGLSSVYLATRCREHWYPNWTESIKFNNQINCAALWLHFLEWCKCWYGSRVKPVCMHSSGIGSCWIIELASNEQKQRNCKTSYMENFNRDVHRDTSGIDDRDFVEERRVGQPSLFTILTT